MSHLTVTIYGASDDLVEVKWAGENKPRDDEFDINFGGNWFGKVTDPATGEFLVITAAFGKSGAYSDWTVGVENGSSPFPTWPIQFGERPDREGDPAIIITVPRGTIVSEIE